MAETEAVLLRRFVRSGDAEAFAEIIQRYAGLVYSAALRVLADVDRASDIAQDTFLQLAKDAGNVTGSLPGWLHRVATHKAIDQIRRDATRKHREAEYMAARPQEAAEWKDISPHVDEGLNLLDPHLRSILISHFLEGRSTREIARAHGLSQATISRRIEAGVEQLRAGLRRRGVLVAAGALGLLLSENAVQAASPALLTELGKIALISGSLAVSTTATGAASGFGALVADVLGVVKANAVAVAVAAAAIVGVGSVITYQQVTKPAGEIWVAPVGAAARGAAGLALTPAFSPSVGAAMRDGPGLMPDPRTAAAGLTGGAEGHSPYPARQGLPGPEAETDPRTYVPHGAEVAVASAVAGSAPAQDAPDQSVPIAGVDFPGIPRDPISGDSTKPATAPARESPYETVMRLRREAEEESTASALGGPDFPVSVGLVVARAELKLTPPFMGSPVGVIGLQQEDTTTVKPDAMLETPPDAPREPVYFVVRAGDREIQGITYRSICSPEPVMLWLDTDGDGLWSDEKGYVGRRLWIYSTTATYEFGPVFLKQGSTEPGGEAFYAQCSNGRWMTCWPAFYRAGEVLLDGKTYRVALVDSDFDGRFNELPVPPVMDDRNPGCDVFAMDLDGDFRFRYDRTGESEIAPLGKLIRVGGRYYGIEATEDGSTVEFRQAEPVLRQEEVPGLRSEAAQPPSNAGKPELQSAR